ncbi:MAG: hypothetical protein WBL07_07545 [Thiothrix litoralis]|jgi:hypothetical protein|uniref:tetratricopeptide repeat protein n=1 Tax=Thiothrix litoralis TaxID=2891210 RepID=UPI003C781431
MDIDKKLVIAELDAILASPRFRARKVIKTFLRYAVQETLAGRGSSLNQQSIAIEALGKPSDFSPTYNPLVRIEAGRLRKLLQEHYADASNTSAVIITMPKGRYQVSFRPGTPPLTITPPVVDDLVLSLTEGPKLFLSCQLLDPHSPTTVPMCNRLRGELLLILSRFRNIRLVTQQHSSDYTITCDIQSTAAEIELFFVLTHTLSDALVCANTLRLPTNPSQADLDALCLQVAANTVALHSGKIMYHWAQYQLSLTMPLPPQHEALVHYLAFLRNITPDSFSIALNACRQRLKHFPNDSKALVILARLCGYDHVLQYHLIENLEATWTHAARTAMKLDPGNAEAHSIFAHNRYFLGDDKLCRAELGIARQTNPFDTSIEYLYGFGLYMLGDQETGIQAIYSLMAIPFPQPDWYHVLPFLHAFNQGDYQVALARAERIQRFGFWGEMARCVSYFHLGQQERSLQELKELLHYNSKLLNTQNPDNRSIFSHEALKKVLSSLQEIKKLIVR